VVITAIQRDGTLVLPIFASIDLLKVIRLPVIVAGGIGISITCRVGTLASAGL
jgi:phosphoribosylformimino-5-aminoimidazole carboxamide ribonucleotide (ProFAR) isomerase